MSHIHFKFKAAKDYSSIPVDGLGLSVFDFKKEIILSKKLKGDDFDLVLSNAESGEEYYDDASIIPRNSSILVRRVPVPKKPGVIAGASKYLSGSGPSSMSARSNRTAFPSAADSNKSYSSFTMNTSKSRQFSSTNSGGGIPGLDFGSSASHDDRGGGDTTVEFSNDMSGSNEEAAVDEEEKIKAMFAQSNAYWEETQEKMAGMRKIHLNRSFPPGSKPPFRPKSMSTGSSLSDKQFRPAMDQKPPPPSYTCFRCGEKGHYIQNCPTNGDKAFDRPKVKRTTGIPKSFLKVIEDPTEVLQERRKEGLGVMIDKDGKVVQVMSNDSAWQKIHSQTKYSVTNEDSLLESAPVLPEYQCFICQRIMKEASSLPCCDTNYCDECIRQSLTEDGPDHLKCPNCSSDAVPDSLIPNTNLRNEISAYLRDCATKRAIEAKQSGAAPISQSSSRSNTPTNVTRDGSSVPVPTNMARAKITFIDSADQGTKSQTTTTAVASSVVRPRPQIQAPPVKIQTFVSGTNIAHAAKTEAARRPSQELEKPVMAPRPAPAYNAPPEPYYDPYYPPPPHMAPPYHRPPPPPGYHRPIRPPGFYRPPPSHAHPGMHMYRPRPPMGMPMRPRPYPMGHGMMPPRPMMGAGAKRSFDAYEGSYEEYNYPPSKRFAAHS